MAVIAVTILHPWLWRFAWAWPFLLILYERQSKFLRHASADAFFVLLKYAIIRSLIEIILSLIESGIFNAKDGVTRERLQIAYQTIALLPRIITVALLIYGMTLLYFGFTYRLVRRRKGRRLSGALLRYF